MAAMVSDEITFKISHGFKIFFWILAVLCFLLVLMIPASILLIWVIYKAEVRMTYDELEVQWIGRKKAYWKEITELKWLPALNYVQRKMRPLAYKGQNPTRKFKGGIPVGAFERTDELLAELQKRSGQTIQPR